MSDVLSQNEVDALLAAVSSTGARRPASDDVKYYDFLRPERASSATMRGLVDVHEAAGIAIADALSSALNLGVDCRLRSFDQVAWGEFIVALPNPTCFAVIEAEKAGGRFAVEIGPGIVFPMIERLLGAPDGAEPDVPDRPMTEIERRVAATVAGVVVDALATAWRIPSEARPAVAVVESNPRIVQVGRPMEMAALATFDITLGSRSGLAHVAMPFGEWGRFLEDLAAEGPRDEGNREDASAEAEAVRGALARVPLRVEAMAVSTRMKLREIAGLSAGSVLETRRRVGDDVVVTVGGREKFRATEGTMRGRRAVRLGGGAADETGAADAAAGPSITGTPPEGKS